MTREPRGGAAALGGLLAYSAALAWVFASFTADDAFIVARVAEHWRRFGEPTFNLGDRVNVLTSPLEAVVMTLLFMTTGHTLTAYKILSGATVLAALSFAALSDARGARASALFLSLTAASPFVALWTYGGLETPLLLGAVTVVVLSTEAAARGSRRHRVALSLGVILAFWARYDSVIFTVFPLGYVALSDRRARRPVMWAIATLAACATAVGLPAAYFGHALPTPWFVKTPRLWPPIYLLKNAFYACNFLLLSGSIVPLLLPKEGPRPDSAAAEAPQRWLLAGLVGVGIYALSCASVHMMFSYRLFVPYLPALVIFASECAPRAKPSWAVIAAIVLGQGGLTWYVSARSINPTLLNLLHLGIRGPNDTPVLQKDPPGFQPYLYEYPREGARAYEAGFLRGLRESLGDLARDWSARSTTEAGPPRIYTFAAGQLPYEYPDAYVYDSLSSYRQRCDYDVRRSAHYVLTMSPRRGSVDEQLAPATVPPQRVSERKFVFDGEIETLALYFQPNPEPNRLPKTLDAPCESALAGPND